MVSLSLEAELLQEARLEVGLLAREVGDLLLLEGCLELGYLCGNQPVRRVHPASRRWRGGRRDDSARTCRKILISTQVADPLQVSDGQNAAAVAQQPAGAEHDRVSSFHVRAGAAREPQDLALACYLCGNQNFTARSC